MTARASEMVAVVCHIDNNYFQGFWVVREFGIFGLDMDGSVCLGHCHRHRFEPDSNLDLLGILDTVRFDDRAEQVHHLHHLAIALDGPGTVDLVGALVGPDVLVEARHVGPVVAVVLNVDLLEVHA